MRHLHGLFALIVSSDTSNSVLAHRGRLLRRSKVPSDHFVHPVFSLILLKDPSHRSFKRRVQTLFHDNLQHAFASRCKASLLASETMEDGIISQNECAQFLLSLCKDEGLCNKNEKLTFEELDLSLQLEFVRGFCPYEDMKDRVGCIRELDMMWQNGNAFGFRTNTENLPEVVEKMCYKIYEDVVEMGLTRTLEPTSKNTYQPSNLPSYTTTSFQPMLPSVSPSPYFSNFPSSKPSVTEYTMTPATFTISTSFATSNPSFSLTVSQPTSPNSHNTEIPSSTDGFTAGVSSKPTIYSTTPISPQPSKTPTQNNGLLPNERSKKSIVAVSAVLALTFFLIGTVLILRRSNYFLGSKYLPDGYFSKDANHFGTVTHEVWSRSPSFPLGYMCANPSSSSSSSSFRDYRFVLVFGPSGEAVAQFNPNTASAVVIGSVTIGASSSISTGPFAKDEESQCCASKPQPSIALGKLPHVKERTTSEFRSRNALKDDVSSLSSNRSSTFQNRSSLKRLLPISQERRYGDKNTSRIDGSEVKAASVISRSTIPMTQPKVKRLERRLVHFDNHLSFADWKAATSMIAEHRNPEQVTDSAAALRQKKFFFDVFSAPMSETSDISPTTASFRSHDITTNLVRDNTTSTNLFSELLKSAVGGNDTNSVQQQIMKISSGSPYVGPDGSVTYSSSSNVSSVPATEVFLPWRKGGFSSLLQLSDSKQSDESICSFESSCLDPNVHFIRLQQKYAVLNPLKSLLAESKSKIKGWFNRKQYHHLNGNVGLHEDQSVLSMESYSSRMNLIPPNMKERTFFGLPDVILGTWAAATIPLERKPIYSPHAGLQYKLAVPVDFISNKSETHSNHKEPYIVNEEQHDAPLLYDAVIELMESTVASTILGIDRKDTTSHCSKALSRSDFESSNGWSSSSSNSSQSFVSSSPEPNQSSDANEFADKSPIYVDNDKMEELLSARCPHDPDLFTIENYSLYQNKNQETKNYFKKHNDISLIQESNHHDGLLNPILLNAACDTADELNHNQSQLESVEVAIPMMNVSPNFAESAPSNASLVIITGEKKKWKGFNENCTMFKDTSNVISDSSGSTLPEDIAAIEFCNSEKNSWNSQLRQELSVLSSSFHQATPTITVVVPSLHDQSDLDSNAWSHNVSDYSSNEDFI